MRLCLVTETYPPEINGVALTVSRMADYLRGQGHQLDLIRPRQPHEAAGPADDARELRSAGLAIPMYSSLRMGFVRPGVLRQRWQRFGLPDLVHVTTPGPLGWAAASAARAEGVPLTMDYRTHFAHYSAHYGLAFAAPVIHAGLRRLHAQADCSFAPTRALATQLQADGFGTVHAVGRGVDSQAFAPEFRDAALRRSWRAGPWHTVLLYVGRLAAEKNVELALDTFEHLRLKRRGLRMVVVGDGPLRARLQRAHPRAVFTGAQRGAALAAHYASADVFLFPSLTDTFGNVTLEAMASGLAVVAFNTGAAGEHLADGHSACLAPMPHRPLGGVHRAGPYEWQGEGPGQAAAAFSAAAMRALGCSQPQGPLRSRARGAALLADWPRALQGFERHLREIAALSRPGTDVAMA